MDTATTLPEVTSLPPLDVARIAAAAEVWLTTAMGTVSAAEERASRAAKLVDKEKRAADSCGAQRDAAAYTLVRAYRVRRGAGIANALGVPRSSWLAIRRRMEQRQPELVPNAVERLPGLAFKTATHLARLEAARKVRDAAVLELSAAGWTNAALGKLIGRDHSRISHIKHSAETAKLA